MSIDLFDGHGMFQMPSAEQLATLSPEQRAGFESVRAAAEARERAMAATKAAQAAVETAVTELRNAENAFRKLCPPMSAVDAARAWMRTNK